MSSKDKMLVYVSSPDSYADAFRVFYHCYMMNWDSKKYEFVLSSNNAQYEKIRVFNTHKTNDNWAERTIACLNQVDAKYILLMCDDLMITEKVDEEKIDCILNAMDEYNLNFCRLKPYQHGKKVQGFPSLRYVKKTMPYGLNLQIGIYNRVFLLKLLGDGSRSAWDIEKKFLKDSSVAKAEYFSDVVVCDQPVIQYIHAIVKGKWFPSVRKKLNKLNIEVQSEREIMSLKEEWVINVKGFVGAMLPPKLRLTVKKILRKCGIAFVAEK